MKKVHTESQTRELAAKLAKKLFSATPVFLELSGPMGAGKSTFARAFIEAWLKAAGESAVDSIPSPTYNIIKTYGSSPKSALAHFDLFRLESMRELEDIGFETYFYETACCIVEWLEKIDGYESLRPPNTIRVDIEIADALTRKITIQDPTGSSLKI